MLTEDEAITRWCPFVRMAHRGDPELGADATQVGVAIGTPMSGFNRRTDSGWDDCGGTHCIASECMAWRWDPLPVKRDDKFEDAGFCGLAGKP